MLEEKVMDKNILIITNNFGMETSLSLLLLKHGYEVHTTKEEINILIEVLKLEAYREIDLIIIDLDFEYEEVEGILNYFDYMEIEIPFIILESHINISTRYIFRSTNVIEYIFKPFYGERLIELIKKILNK